MQQERLRERINALQTRKQQAHQMHEQISRELLVIAGAIQENTDWLNKLIADEKAATEAKVKEQELKKRTRAKKEAPVTEQQAA